MQRGPSASGPRSCKEPYRQGDAFLEKEDLKQAQTNRNREGEAEDRALGQEERHVSNC